MHAGACGLDRSVEGKEVGLDRDFLAELDDLIDPVGLSAEDLSRRKPRRRSAAHHSAASTCDAAM
jgi:hypothetical protein